MYFSPEKGPPVKYREGHVELTVVEVKPSYPTTDKITSSPLDTDQKNSRELAWPFESRPCGSQRSDTDVAAEAVDVAKTPTLFVSHIDWPAGRPPFVSYGDFASAPSRDLVTDVAAQPAPSAATLPSSAPNELNTLRAAGGVSVRITRKVSRCATSNPLTASNLLSKALSGRLSERRTHRRAGPGDTNHHQGREDGSGGARALGYCATKPLTSKIGNARSAV